MMLTECNTVPSSRPTFVRHGHCHHLTHEETEAQRLGLGLALRPPRQGRGGLGP